MVKFSYACCQPEADMLNDSFLLYSGWNCMICRNLRSREMEIARWDQTLLKKSYFLQRYNEWRCTVYPSINIFVFKHFRYYHLFFFSWCIFWFFSFLVSSFIRPVVPNFRVSQRSEATGCRSVKGQSRSLCILCSNALQWISNKNQHVRNFSLHFYDHTILTSKNLLNDFYIVILQARWMGRSCHFTSRSWLGEV